MIFKDAGLPKSSQVLLNSLIKIKLRMIKCCPAESASVSISGGFGYVS
jgi:hypothetical protein